MSILWMAFFAEAEGEMMDIPARNQQVRFLSRDPSLPLYPVSSIL